MFYIEWLRVYGNNQKYSEVKFGRKLNIIVGPSNCGKTMILKCIDYLLGSVEIPFDKDHYNSSKAEMKIGTDDGYIIISREFGKNSVLISGSSKLIPIGEYSINASKSKLTYGQALMGLLGVDLNKSPIKIFNNKDAQVCNLSIRQLVNTFIVKEEPIISKDNILIPDKSTSTLLEAAILYQLYGKNYITGNEKDPSWVREKKAIKKYISLKIQELEKNNDWLTMPLYNGAENTISENADAIVDDLDVEYKKIQEKFAETIKEVGKLSAQITSLNEKLFEDNDLIEKCQGLKDQYQADVKRIEFILEGKMKIGEVHEPECCPFCGGHMKEDTEADCLDALEKDMTSLVAKIADLDNELSSLENERADLSKQHDLVKKQYDSANDFLNQNYYPQVRSIKKKMKAYGQSMQEAKEKEIIRNNYEYTCKQLDEVSSELKKAITEFNPLKHFDNFFEPLSSRLAEALSYCHFPHSESAKIDPKTFDICIGSQTKNDYGKGYTAFLNSVFTSVLHEFINENGTYKGTPFIIDSPIMSLKEIKDTREKKDDDKLDDALEMKKPLFEQFLKMSDSSQVIVIENEVPADVDYGTETVFVRFGGEDGRKGFISEE